MGKALYRKYRSRSLDEIVGQNHITQLLRQSIAADAVSHAYLLTGPKGVGKTSIARIIAHEINNLPYDDEISHLDIIEIDAASNNGVEDVRDLREKVHIAPSIARKKVYIIDEVHMLSKAAFNALLKTLEEPPSHVVFILATTDVEKLPQTIISRVQRFNFRAIPRATVVIQLRSIATKESILIDDAALERIADYGEGSFRDSIGLLDQLKDSVAPEIITLENVNATLGATDMQTITTLLDAHESQDLPAIITTIEALEASGTNPKVVLGQLITATTSQLASNPGSLSLLDELTSLNLTRYPYLRLLIALSKFIPITKQHAPVRTQSPMQRISSPKSKQTTIHKPTTTNNTAIEASSIPTPSVPDKPIADFSWSSLIAGIKDEAPAAAALLNQSEYILEDTTLSIYTKQSFRAKRLQSAKYMILLNKSLTAMGFSFLAIEVSADAKPSTNSSVTAVTDIMGGGEEVTPDVS